MDLMFAFFFFFLYKTKKCQKRSTDSTPEELNQRAARWTGPNNNKKKKKWEVAKSINKFAKSLQINHNEMIVLSLCVILVSFSTFALVSSCLRINYISQPYYSTLLRRDAWMWTSLFRVSLLTHRLHRKYTLDTKKSLLWISVGISVPILSPSRSLSLRLYRTILSSVCWT